MAIEFVKTARIPLDDISVAEDSSWRDLDSKRVEALEKVIYQGDFGNTTLTKPSLLCDQADKAVVVFS